ncbi:hypothetical protein PMAYCL1PPCAC_31549, partial [Pristionchus mayeri]
SVVLSSGRSGARRRASTRSQCSSVSSGRGGARSGSLRRSGSGSIPAARSRTIPAGRRASARSSSLVRSGSRSRPATAATSSTAGRHLVRSIVLGDRYTEFASIDELPIGTILCVLC